MTDKEKEEFLENLEEQIRNLLRNAEDVVGKIDSVDIEDEFFEVHIKLG